MQVIAVRCPRCLLTIFTIIRNNAPGNTKIFMVAPLADQDLLFYNCPMDVCEYHIQSPNPTNLYRNSTIGYPMNKTPGLIISPRTSDTIPFRTAEQVAALAINVDLDDTDTAPVTEGVDIPITTATSTPTTTAPATEPKPEPEPEPARPPPVMAAWRANAVPRPTTERPTPERPAAKRRAIERPAAEQSATTIARFVGAPQTPQRSNGDGYQAGRNGASVPPVADIPRPTLAQPTGVEKPNSVEKPIIAEPTIEKPFTAKPAIEKPFTAKAIAGKPTPEQPTIQTPAAEKPHAKKHATEQPKIETPAREQQAFPQVDGHEAARQNGTGSPAAAETQQQQQQQTTGIVFKGKWTDAEVDRLKELNGQNLRHAAIASEMNRTILSIKAKLADVRHKTEKQARAAAGQETEPNNGQTQT